MEHKLITGGGQYLPFARSRIKALRATGLKYASQKFEVDGCSIKVRIADDHEFIELSGGSTSLVMDSGVFSVHNIAEMNPATYLPGTLLEAGSAADYNAPFVVDESNLPGRTNPEKTSRGQLSGVITKGAKFRGRIMSQQAFAPVMQGTKPSQTADPHDDLLRTKKLLCVLCPPSIFTGRCRMYVQAMYGLPLYEYDKNGNVANVNSPPMVESTTEAAPALWIPSYVSKEDKAEYRDILLDTSCGVWLDKDTGKHWLFVPADGVTRVFPMISSKAGESLRKYLITKGDPLLNEVDREHLEAYILAYCLPDVKHEQMGSSTAGAQRYSMGYGWHWNWDGDTADVVNNDQIPQDLSDTNFAMRSTHYRMNVKKLAIPEPQGGFASDDHHQLWETPVTIVAGPTDWSAYRVSWAIAEPNYATMELSKICPQHSIVFECDATFYAFYVRNELKTCSIKVEWADHEASTPARTMSPRYAVSSAYGSNIEHATFGDGGGSLDDRGGKTAHFRATVSCAGHTSPPLPSGASDDHATYVFSPKTLIGMVDDGQSWSNYGTRTYYDGSSITGSIKTYSGLFSYSIASDIVHKEWFGLATVVVPFYDAEAVFMHSVNRHDTFKTGSVTQFNAHYPGHNYARAWLVDANGSTSMAPTVYGWDNGGWAYADSIGSSTPTSSTELVTDSYSSKLLGRAGGADTLEFPHLSQLHANDMETVSGAAYNTTSGTRTDDPIVIATGFIDPIGVSEPGAAVITGWV